MSAKAPKVPCSTSPVLPQVFKCSQRRNNRPMRASIQRIMRGPFMLRESLQWCGVGLRVFGHVSSVFLRCRSEKHRAL